jgi:hypothetical protein
MGQLCKIGLIFSFFWSVFGLVGVAKAQGACSLTVTVVSPNRKPVAAIVSVHETNGRKIEKDYLSRDLQFCDLGILPISVTVSRRPGCNEVTVRDLSISIDRAYHLTVVYDPNNCTPETVPPPLPTCEVLIRVQNQEGKYVPDSKINLRTPTIYESKTDRFGRLLISGKIGAPITGTVTATGYANQDFSFTCKGYDPEETIVHLGKL